MLHRTFRRVAFLLVAAAIPLLAACDSTTPRAEGDARVHILLTDAPFPFELVAEANVTIERVFLLRDEGDFEGEDFENDDFEEREDGIVLLTDEPQRFNLLQLRDGVTAELAQLDVPAGDYRQIRLIVSEDAEVVLNDGTVYDLRVPSGTQTGIKIPLPTLALEDEDLAIVTLDFDVGRSFVVQGNPDTPAGIRGFTFKPVVKPIALRVDGEVMPIPDDAEEDAD